MAVRGDAARVVLIETAERLFAERGIEAVSMRDIAAAAGQRNHSATQYHFGDRAGLVAAVFEHRMRLVNDRRHGRLDTVETTGRTDDLVAVVDATVRPLAEVVEETDGWYGRFLARAQWDAFARDVVAGLPVLSSYRRAVALLRARLDLPSDVRSGRLDQMATLFIGTIAGWEWRRHDGRRMGSFDKRCADLTATCTAVLTAPILDLARSTP
jgi:AcrR family transcriptional regulator